MKEIYSRPAVISSEHIHGSAPVVGLLVAYAAGRAVKKAMDARPLKGISCLQKCTSKDD